MASVHTGMAPTSGGPTGQIFQDGSGDGKQGKLKDGIGSRAGSKTSNPPGAEGVRSPRPSPAHHPSNVQQAVYLFSHRFRALPRSRFFFLDALRGLLFRRSQPVALQVFLLKPGCRDIHAANRGKSTAEIKGRYKFPNLVPKLELENTTSKFWKVFQIPDLKFWNFSKFGTKFGIY